MRPVHYCSLIPIFLESICKNKNDGSDITLSTATGCLYKQNNCVYLVTNWHVLSGRHTETRKILSSCGVTPEFIRAHFSLDANVTEHLIKDFAIKYQENTFHWLEHPLSSKVDVGVLKIEPPAEIATKYVNDLQNFKDNKNEEFFFVTQDVWVIGFPRGIRISGLPIWKSATIASEPFASTKNNMHKIILDTATREGINQCINHRTFRCI